MKEAIKITESEIEWHKENKSEAPTLAYAEAFVRGLEHLLDLFKQAENLQQEDSADLLWPKCGERRKPHSDRRKRGW